MYYDDLEIRQMGREFAYNPHEKLLGSVRFIANAARPMGVILNERQGVRQLVIGESLLLMIGLIIVSFFLEPGYGEEMIVITLAFLVALGVRRADAWDAIRTGRDDRHTYFMGESILTPIIPSTLPLGQGMGKYWFIQRLVHPTLMLLLAGGVYLTGESLVVTGFLVVSGLATAIVNGARYAALLDEVFDQYDSTLERNHLPEVLTDREGRAGEDYGMPTTPFLQDVLERIPTPDMEDVVGEVMSHDDRPPSDPPDLKLMGGHDG